MAQPVLYTIPSFDADLGANINFAFDGDQVFGNELVIIDNETNAQVYDVKMNDWMRLYHTIGVDNDLVNGKYYACKVRVFNKSGQASDWSTLRSFYCFKTPVLKFVNLEENEVLQKSECTLKLEYEQEQGEPLNIYNVMLYNANRVLLVKSENLYGSDNLEYTFKQLEDGTQYYVRATGSTLNGMNADTGYVSFSVKYITPAYWTYVDLSNNKDDGSIRISCNIRSITGICSEDPSFINDQMIDLADGSSVIFNDGFVQSGDFTIKMLGSGFVDNNAFFEMYDQYGNTIRIIYREGWFAKNTLFAEGMEEDDEMLGCYLSYFIAEAEPNSKIIKYVVLSNAVKQLQDGEEYFILLQRINDVYYIRSEITKIQDVNPEKEQEG